MKRAHAIVALLLPAACNAAPAASAAPPTADVAFVLSSKAEVHVKVELARNDDERRRGLMYRRSLASGSGMLFLFPEAGSHQFWMHNTYIPLDMVFLDADKKVVFVEERAEPMTDTPRGPTSPTRYVVEVPGGWARSHGIEPGVTARFSGVPDGAH